MTIAQKYEADFRLRKIDLDTVACEKDNNWEQEKTTWIFNDGSALSMDSDLQIELIEDYGLNVDNEQL